MNNLLKMILLVTMCAAVNVQAQPKNAVEQFIRVGGNYTVKSVEQKSGNVFLVKFTAENKSGNFDELELESDHVHVAVKVGRTLRLSAEVLKTTGPKAEISQVVLFFPNAEGHVPVWLMSNKFPDRDLKASKYLEMHAPINDYMIL
jgi:hypothetical protein